MTKNLHHKAVSSSHVAVIGAGPSGLIAAHLLNSQNYPVTLFESHSKPGGCASFFRRKITENEYAVFDAGATILNRFENDQFMNKLFRKLDIPLPSGYQRLSQICLSTSETKPIWLNCSNLETYINSLLKHFPQDRDLILDYLKPLSKKASILIQCFETIPHLPIETFSDLKMNSKLSAHLFELSDDFCSGFLRSFADKLKSHSVSEELLQWIEMNLLITLQCTSKECHPLYGAIGLFFYAFGAGEFKGGMKSLFVNTLEALQKRENVKVFMKTPIIHVEHTNNQFFLHTTHGKYGPYSAVFTSIPRFSMNDLLINSNHSEAPSSAEQSLESPHPEWSAFVGYYVVKDDTEWPSTNFHVHSSLSKTIKRAAYGADAYLSFSSRDEASRSPIGMRTLTISTHVPIEPNNFWPNFFDPHTFNKESKNILGDSILTQHLKNFSQNIEIVYKEYASPKTFLRYTRRSLGSVGGYPLNYKNSFFQSPSQRYSIKNLFQIGDTAFPGQSIYSAAVGSIAAVEKFAGVKISI